MADKILMNTVEVEGFRQGLFQLAQRVQGIVRDIQYIEINFDEISAAMSVMQEKMREVTIMGNYIVSVVERLSYELESAKSEFVQADSTAFKSIYRGDTEDKKASDTSNPVDSVLTSPYTSGAVGATDKVIATASEKGLLGKRTNTIETGYNRATRRKFGLPKTIEEVKPGVELREGFGIVGTGLALTTAYEDFKNNNTVVSKVGSTAIDEGATFWAAGKMGIVAEFGSTVGVGIVEGGATAIGVVAAPEIVVAGAAVVGYI